MLASLGRGLVSSLFRARGLGHSRLLLLLNRGLQREKEGRVRCTERGVVLVSRAHLNNFEILTDNIPSS